MTGSGSGTRHPRTPLPSTARLGVQRRFRRVPRPVVDHGLSVVTHDLVALLGPDGVARTADVARVVDRHSIGVRVAAGRLIRPYPGVVVVPERMAEWRTRALAAVFGTGGVLSHTSALAVWRLAAPRDPVHVSVSASRRALRRPGLAVHPVHDLPADRLGPYPVTPLARARGHLGSGSRRARVPRADAR